MVRVARLNVGAGSGFNLVSNLESFGSKNVSLFAVLIFKKSDVSRSVGIVFKSFDRCKNVKLVSLEVDDTILSSVSAAAVANGDASVAVTAALFVESSEKTSLRAAL